MPQLEAHLEALYLFNQNPRQIAQAAFAKPEDLDSFKERWTRNAANPENLFFTIVDGSEICGSVGKWVLDGQPVLAYWIGEPHEGKGIATWAVAEFLEVFTERPLLAHIVEDNVGSMRVLEKNGFIRVDSWETDAPGRTGLVTEIEYRLGA